MNRDLKIIRKKYGEKMMHYCRKEFATILEQDGLLPHLLFKHFEPNHSLFDDLIKFDRLYDFKNYIYTFIKTNKQQKTNKKPEELFDDIGYRLYECKTEEEIQSFKKYYFPGEQLCTFKDERLKDYYVFFAVKKDVEKYKRSDYLNPRREDDYGTSVLSIQFTRDNLHTVSIINRYNHTIDNPNATFSNNLDYIIPGLANSFATEYGLIQKQKNSIFEMDNYINVDGKFYRYNYELDKNFYGSNNNIICDSYIDSYEKESYIVFDYFILDLRKKAIYDLLDYEDAFVTTIPSIKDIKIIKRKEGKAIKLIPFIGEKITIGINNDNQMIYYCNPNINKLLNNKDGIVNFLSYSDYLKAIKLPNLVECGDDFLFGCSSLNYAILPKLKIIGTNFLGECDSIEELIYNNQCFLKNKEKQKIKCLK